MGIEKVSFHVLKYVRRGPFFISNTSQFHTWVTKMYCGAAPFNALNSIKLILSPTGNQ